MRQFGSGEFEDPLLLRGLVGGSFIVAAIASYLHRRMAQALPAIFLGLCFVFVGWTIWLGWLNRFPSSDVDVVDLEDRFNRLH